MKKLLLMFLFLSILSVSFSSWQINVGISVFASFLILVIIYAVAFGFEIDTLKVTTKEEMVQLIFTVVIAASLIGIGTYLDDLGIDISSMYGSSNNIQDHSLILVNEIMDSLANSYISLNEFGQEAMYESSRTYICVIFSSSFFVSSCNSYSLLSQSFSIGMQAIAICFAELQALSILLSIGEKFGFTVFLPFGLFLRTFKFSRGAGAFFISLGVTFYFILPLSVVFMEELNQQYTPPEEKSLHLNSCEVESTGGVGHLYMDNPNNVKDALGLNNG
jgi:hypothetical protein